MFPKSVICLCLAAMLAGLGCRGSQQQQQTTVVVNQQQATQQQAVQTTTPALPQPQPKEISTPQTSTPVVVQPATPVQPVPAIPSPVVRPENAIPSPVSEDFKMNVFNLIRERQFPEAYRELSRVYPQDDWSIANKIFVNYALKKLNDNSAFTSQVSPEQNRATAKALIDNGRNEEALEFLFTVEPKDDQDIAYMMTAAHNLFKNSGGQQITRYLATVLVGFVHARNQNKSGLEADCKEYLHKVEGNDLQVNRDEYKKALVDSRRFFEEMIQSFEELTVRHLERAGYDPLDIQSAPDRRELLAKKAQEGDRYSQLYLGWYDNYKEFNKLVMDLLLEISLK